MEVIYKNQEYKSDRKPPKDPGSGKRKLPVPPTKNVMMEGGDSSSGISEQPMDPKYTEVSEEDERSGTSVSVSELEDGCTIDEAGVVIREVSDEVFHTSTLNGIVLEYLELMGLEESYKTFWKECGEKSIPIPHDVRDPFFERSNFTETEVTQFFVHFEKWDGDGLSELWTKFRAEVEETEGARTEGLGQVTIFLRIFIASFPFRRNDGEEVKTRALDNLREFHQANSEEFTKDPLCLPLFAFPFVANPTLHPAFKKIFTDEWQNDLRKQLESVFGTHLESSASYGVSTCDLKQMYDHYVMEASPTPGGVPPRGVLN